MEITREFLEAELTDCRSQRDQCNMKIANMQQAIDGTQQAIAHETMNIVRCNGGEAQLIALLAHLDEGDGNGALVLSS